MFDLRSMVSLGGELARAETAHAPSRFKAWRIDDETVRYIDQAGELFSDLRLLSCLCAGLMILDETHPNNSAMLYPMIERARDTLRETRDRVRGLRSTPLAEAHHSHLLSALGHLEATFAFIEQRRLPCSDARDPLPALQSSWRELLAASKALPGFDTVDVSDSCCARHSRIRNLDRDVPFKSRR
jgi:hypothetical protein